MHLKSQNIFLGASPPQVLSLGRQVFYLREKFSNEFLLFLHLKVWNEIRNDD